MKLPLLLVILSQSLHAQSAGPYQLDWSTVDGGGGSSSSGRYRVTGSIGQPDAGQLSGGHYLVEGGFWCELPVVLNDGDVLLKIRRAPAVGYAELYWPIDVNSFAVEAANSLTSADWQLISEACVESATDHIVTVPISSYRYFRLHPLQP